jgi:hypothetical protein
MDVTWWCYNSVGVLTGIGKEFGTLPGGKGDLASGGRASYTPPKGPTSNYYVQFTNIDGERTYSPWTPSNAATLARIDGVGPLDTITFRRGSGKWEAVRAPFLSPQVG